MKITSERRRLIAVDDHEAVKTSDFEKNSEAIKSGGAQVQQIKYFRLRSTLREGVEGILRAFICQDVMEYERRQRDATRIMTRPTSRRS